MPLKISRYLKTWFLLNGFEKKQTFQNKLLKAFSSEIPQSIQLQNKGTNEHDGEYIPNPVVDRNPYSDVRLLTDHVTILWNKFLKKHRNSEKDS